MHYYVRDQATGRNWRGIVIYSTLLQVIVEKGNRIETKRNIEWKEHRHKGHPIAIELVPR